MLAAVVLTAALSHPSASACFAEIFKAAGYGFRHDERAAFLIARGDGGFDCRMWPRTNGYQSAHWEGPIPANAVAIAHTHPRGLPEPSAHDFAEADRVGLPVVVVTHLGVNVASPHR